MFGIVAVSGDIGCSFGPWLAGLISDYVQSSGRTLSIWISGGLTLEQSGLRSGLLVAIVFPILIALSLLTFRKGKTN